MQNVILNAPHGFLMDDIHRKEIIIHEQQKKIDLLEAELIRSKQKVEELMLQLSKCSDGSYKVSQGRYWSPEEHQRFLEGLKRFGAKDVKAISLHVGTRNATQVRTHAQKYFLRMEREKNGEPAEGSSNDDKKDEALFNNNKWKDDQFEIDVQEECSDKDPISTNNDNNNAPSDPSDYTVSPVSTPPGVVIKVKPEKPKVVPRKRKASKKKSEMGYRPSPDNEIKNERRSKMPSTMPLTSFLPYNHIPNAQTHPNLNSSALSNKIIAETSETVLYTMKNWNQQDYTFFVEGLICVQEEKDNTLKCMVIRDKFLPHHSLEDVLKCYSLLQGVAMKETFHQTSFTPYAPQGEIEQESKRIRVMSSPAPSDLHFNTMPFTGSINESMPMRFPYGGINNPYHAMGRFQNPSQFVFPTHFESSYSPAFPALDSNHPAAQRNDIMPRIIPTNNENEFDSEQY